MHSPECQPGVSLACEVPRTRVQARVSLLCELQQRVPRAPRYLHPGPLSAWFHPQQLGDVGEAGRRELRGPRGRFPGPRRCLLMSTEQSAG